MSEEAGPFPEVLEFDDDASYSWWRDSHPEGFILAIRARHPPLLHRAVCSDLDRDRHPGRLKAKGSRQLCADMKSALRAWANSEVSPPVLLLARCPKCAP